MATALLTTRLHIPPVRSELVPRVRLIERLNAGLERKLTLISAPAGFGKTTLVSDWARHVDRAVAWLSLDRSDNDPGRFLAYFVAALQTVDKDIGADVLEALPVAQGLPLEGQMTALVNQISAFPKGLVLILDDYHLITAETIHNAFAFLLDHLPASMHLVLATRADPPLPIARLRARGELTELRLADLRFTVAEAAAFLNQVMGLSLGSEGVSALTFRTEGWIAGLQMAAVSMQGRNDVDTFVSAFTGSHRYIMDYLLTEVLERQPPNVQGFMLQTSILEQLSGSLCDAVIGQDGGAQSTLERLERGNLFVIALDNQRQWYRYHRLFADLLRKRLADTHPDLVPQLHRRASTWFEQHGMLPEAIEHALAVPDHVRAADLVGQVAEETVMRSEVATFLRWVDSLPGGLVAARPALALTHAWALLMTGRWVEAIDAYLGKGDSAFASQKMAPLRASLAVFEGRLPDARALIVQALRELPEGNVLLRGVATWNLSLTRMLEGDSQGARQALEELLRMSRGVGNIVLAVLALSGLGTFLRRQGHLQESQVLHERALELATDQSGHWLPAAGEPLMALGELWREWNDLDKSAQYLAEGIECAKRWAEPSSLDGYMSLARLEQARGDVEGADAAIDSAMRLGEQLDIMEMDVLVAMLQARLLLGRGQTGAAKQCIRRWGLDRELSSEQPAPADAFQDGFIRSRLEKYQHILLARLHITEGHPAEALALLEPLLPLVEETQRMDLLLEILGLMALSHQARGDLEQALSALGRALSLAEPEGYVRAFVDEGPAMARLLYQAAARGMAPQYTGKLLAAFPGAEAVETYPAPSVQLVEPLSERELDVVRLIAEGLSNQDIAQQLFLSLSTIKWHTRNIYGKLGVKNRTQAVAKARALGILPQT